MAKVTYGTSAAALVALTTVAKSVLGVRSGAAFGLNLRQVEIGFDGVTAGAAPIFVELLYATFATNAPGTASTSVTPAQQNGRVLAHGVTAAYAWTTEPTALTTLGIDWLVDPNKGLFIYDWDREEAPDCGFSEGFVLRCTPPAAVGCRPSMTWERA